MIPLLEKSINTLASILSERAEKGDNIEVFGYVQILLFYPGNNVCRNMNSMRSDTSLVIGIYLSGPSTVCAKETYPHLECHNSHDKSYSGLILKLYDCHL